MLLLILYWTIMLICYAAASKLRGYAEKFSFMDQALNLVIYLLVCVMGLRMGANEEVTSNLGTIGLQSVFDYTVDGGRQHAGCVCDTQDCRN